VGCWRQEDLSRNGEGGRREEALKTPKVGLQGAMKRAEGGRPL
jgi:hypothetical protein